MSLPDLIKWATDNGTVISKDLSFEEITRGYYGCLNQGSGAEAPYIRLPTKLAITLRAAIDSFNYGAYGDFEAISDQTKNINALLKLYLCRERTTEYIAKSTYGRYLKLLPGLMEVNSPYCWNSQDKALIKGTNLGNSLKENLALLVEEWWQIINLLPSDMPKPQDHFVNMKFYYEYKFHSDDDLYEYFSKSNTDNWTSFSSYLWASLILKSRSFPAYLIKPKDPSNKLDEAMLLPVIDLLNHDMKSDVQWSVDESHEYFEFKSLSSVPGTELFNNYGRKGNEELLLAYGFCIENNDADTAAVKIKLPVEMLPDLEAKGVKLPKIEDYTTSVVRNDSQQTSQTNFEDGLLFFITKFDLPDNLILLFQWLSKNNWENTLSIRMKLAGLNQLRQALEQKLDIIEGLSLPPDDTITHKNIRIYITSQKKLFSTAIKGIKRIEKDMLIDSEIKPKLLTLKTVFKRDKSFADALLVSLGVTSYQQMIENNFQDQAWLLYLIRCHNKKEYENEAEEDKFMPDWIVESFDRICKESKVTPEEIVQFKELYEGLIIPLTQTAPDVFNRGTWTVEDLIYSAKLLDTISFIRGKDKECILVRP